MYMYQVLSILCNVSLSQISERTTFANIDFCHVSCTELPLIFSAIYVDLVCTSFSQKLKGFFLDYDEFYVGFMSLTS